MNNKKRFGQLIAQGRQSANMLGKDLAPRLGISASTLSNYETGNFKYPPDPEFLDLVERVLGVRKRDLAAALGYIDADDGEEHLSPAIRRIQPLMDRTEWTDDMIRLLAQNIRWIQEARQLALGKEIDDDE